MTRLSLIRKITQSPAARGFSLCKTLTTASQRMASVDPKAVADGVLAQAAMTQTPKFLMVSASIVNGQSWCGDCRRAEPLIAKKLPGDEPLRLTNQYAGDRETWRNPENVWRKFGVTALPTLFKVTPDGTWSSLVEGEVYDEEKLNKFVDSN